MTVSTPASSKTYDGTGGQITFPTEFEFFTAADIEVIERVIATGAETVKTLTTDYTISGGNGAAGDVTAVDPPPNTVTWTIRRIVAQTQETALPVAGSLPSTAIEKMVDRAVMLIQQHSDELGRALVFPKTDDAALNPTIPSSVDRASKLLAFDTSGNPIVRNLVDGGTGTMSDLADDATPQLGGVLDTNAKAINESEGGAVASVAGVTDIWAVDGNTLHVTGALVITGLGTAPRVGARRRIIADGAFTLTHSANLNCPGAADIVAAVGDSFDVYADTATQLDIQNFTRADGKAVVAPGGVSQNVLINANGSINQRGYVSGAATSGANQYTKDRWRVVVSGQNLTFSDSGGITSFTAPAGGVEQVVEGLLLQSGTYVISFTGTATCKIDGVTKASGDTVSLTGGTNATLRFENGTFSLPVLEVGSTANAYRHRTIQEEHGDCIRYYRRFHQGVRMHTEDASTTLSSLTFETPMRAIPSLTLLDTTLLYQESSSTRTGISNSIVSSNFSANGAWLRINGWGGILNIGAVGAVIQDDWLEASAEL